MSWRVEFSATGAQHTVGLPETAYVALNKTLALLLQDPWALSSPDDPEDPLFRWAPFDEGIGVVMFRLNAEQEIVHVYEVAWAG
ncbi:hypothetical protein [Actinomadura rupiterrae]|uniref:hypothetical protein n=1 Tax=Actinomadura rupiterrae TaxID=559627 RepID=UPI0020A5372A|nr:hypothetical protein [Actinomadura rupiterrae]MCP2337909.1 hypothetical protein [Actinomadura rupiterrae]